MSKIKKEELEELNKILTESRLEPIKGEAKIFKDSRNQYTIRIPIGMAEASEINTKKDRFLLEMDSKGNIKGRLIRK